MRKSKSLSIIMATMLATQGGGDSAVFAMKGKIQDNLLKALFFRPNLMSTLKDFLPNEIDNIPIVCKNPTFLDCLENNDFNVSGLRNSMFVDPISCYKNDPDQVLMRKIIEEDNLELLQQEFEGNKHIVIWDYFLGSRIYSIPILNYCVMKKAMKCFKFLILNGEDPCNKISNGCGDSSWDCMSLAVYFGEWEMVKILEERGMDKLNNPRVWGAAALTHRNKFLQSLLSQKDEVGNNFSKCLNEAMVDAVGGGNMKGVAILISEGADINATDSRGKTPLHVAASSNALQLAKVLISKGADVNAKDNLGYTPLHDAARINAFQLVELLISKGADISAKGHRSETPLHWATLMGSLQSAELLISKGADVNAKDNDEQTPLHWAAKKWDTEDDACRITELLISKGAEINVENLYDETPLELAKRSNYDKLVELLTSVGANIKANKTWRARLRKLRPGI